MLIKRTLFKHPLLWCLVSDFNQFVTSSDPRRVLKSPFQTSVLFLFVVGLYWGLDGTAIADQITKQDGSVLEGTVTGVSAEGQVQVTLSSGSVALPINQLKWIEMAAPAAVNEARSSGPTQVIAVLEPLIQSYQGLPADWIVEAMSLLADAYAEQNNYEKSNESFQQIAKLYGDYGFGDLTKVGMAKNSLKQGHPDQALSLVQPVIDEAHKSMSHSEKENRIYSSAFILYGQILEGQNSAPEALSAYLTSLTIFAHSPDEVHIAQQKVDELRAAHPNLTAP